MNTITDLVKESGITTMIYEMKEQMEETERLERFFSCLFCYCKEKGNWMVENVLLDYLNNQHTIGIFEFKKDDLIHILNRYSYDIEYLYANFRNGMKIKRTKYEKMNKPQLLRTFIYVIETYNEFFLELYIKNTDLDFETEIKIQLQTIQHKVNYIVNNDYRNNHKSYKKNRLKNIFEQLEKIRLY